MTGDDLITTKGPPQSRFPRPDRRDRGLNKRSWVFFIGIFFAAVWAVWASDFQISVSGIGYPPVKAQNKAQALLMAKRAALLDAYRKALSDQNEGSQEENEHFYKGLSGFIKGLAITSEDYLNDGGVRIEATVSKKEISLFHREKEPKKKQSKTGPVRVEGPQSVTVDEWYRVIEKMVIFETKSQKKGAE